jgi:hypothetical protein
MRLKPRIFAVLMVTLLLPISGNLTTTFADDGPMVRKQVTKTPYLESDHAQLSMMQFYVPATKADGSATTIIYYADRDDDNQPDEQLFTRENAKPLVVTYQDEHPDGAAAYDILTGDEVGVNIRRDAFAAISLDDGETWKEVNLSESAGESSIITDEIDGSSHNFPGDVTEVVHAVAGNQILVAWTSKYCEQGSPRYSLKDFDNDGIPDSSSDFPGEEGVPLYVDLFQVAGNQGTIDYTDWMHHGEYPFAHIGVIPFSCVWTARGTVEYKSTGQGSDIETAWGVRWRKAERLTSGRRDAFKLALDGVEGAGFALTWQEDPEGLRPGYGEGPGEGWSGATVNHKADIWYSHIGWDDFAKVDTADQNPETNKPKVAVHMAMPVRTTDNEKCELVADENGKLGPKTNQRGEITMPWCYDLDIGNGTLAGKGTPDGIGDLCPVRKNADGSYTVADDSRVVPWTNSQGKEMNVCISDDRRLLNGQTGSSRARLMMEGYTKPDGKKSAWVAVMYEESKGLGAGHTDDPALDIGKDAMYHTFDMFNPDLAAAGHMLNMPETDPATGGFRPLLTNDLAVALGGAANQYDSSIGRRGSFMLQPTARMVEGGYKAGMTSGIFLYKSGADRQGGPSDIFMRRTVLPSDFDPATDNPFAVENLACDEFDASLSDGDYPTYSRTSYPYGLCVRGARNLSSTTPLTFESLSDAPVPDLPAGHPPVAGSCSSCHTDGRYDDVPSHLITDRVLTWKQTELNLYDEDWTNRYEVAKGHRGFLDGDFVMLMYAWSPNWLATSKGHEPYNLFIRRSFDGGETWTTTPASYGGVGTTYDQAHGVGDRVWTETRTLGPGEFEPARNVSQLTSSKETVLDPRYSPTNMGTQTDVNRVLNTDGTYTDVGDLDIRDPSKFFAVYETGDATVVLTGGEADPWDLFASRATNWGDDWDAVDIYAQGRGEWEERWDWVENKDDTRAGESSIAGSPDGRFAWIVWNEWIERETDKNGDGNADVLEADPMFRRLWWEDADTLIADAGTYEAAEGETVLLVALADYAGNPDELTYSWDLDSDGEFETEGQEVELLATGAMQGVAVKICDAAGYCDIKQGWINPGVHTPRVWKVQATQNPVQAGVPVDLTARFTDPGSDDDHDAVIDWGDGIIEPATIEAGDGKGAALAVGSHQYLEPGLYPVKVTVTDDDGHSGWDYLWYLVVYDQRDGTVDSQVTFQDPQGAGTANLEFNARYRITAVPGVDPTTAIGLVKFNLGNIAFEGKTFDYLVITPNNEVFIKGRGSLNGTEDYRFLIAAVDGKTDLVRMKIWKANGLAGHLVYDSQPGAPEDAVATTVVRKGKITIEQD